MSDTAFNKSFPLRPTNSPIEVVPKTINFDLNFTKPSDSLLTSRLDEISHSDALSLVIRMKKDVEEDFQPEDIDDTTHHETKLIETLRIIDFAANISNVMPLDSDEQHSEYLSNLYATVMEAQDYYYKNFFVNGQQNTDMVNNLYDDTEQYDDAAMIKAIHRIQLCVGVSPSFTDAERLVRIIITQQVSQ